MPGPVAAALYGTVLYIADERLAALARRAAEAPEQAPATTD